MRTSSVVPGGGPVTDAVAVVAVPAQDPAPPPGQGPEFGKASPVALVVILLLALATVFLIRSMTKRIRRLPASFDGPGAAGGAAEDPAAEPERPADASAAEGDAPARTGEPLGPTKDHSG
ncbi:hypothetical protein [Pseudonocardia humida]|uniref:Secreted protein n=1 Tax=Pseudonocardia humida TaxID=2800819 RepID=A0ABT1AAK8_9PSEU|nr:hypothetical protein [Pseudonocardia humida]MCO1660038.1 hypothetical protein [Pseudonocardia humida]